ncbi:MAG: hypothetical protein ACXU8U_07085, partial [Asticcacaulis sp.]
AHQPLYALDFRCAGMHPSVYVYIPQVAKTAAVFQKFLGETGFTVLYLGLFAAALAVLVAVPLWLAPSSWRDKLPFAVFIGGSAVMWGNIAVILHAMILASALALETAPWLFVAAVAVAGAVKPVFLTYLAVILLADLPLTRRLTLCLGGLAAGLMPTLIFVLSDPVTARQWSQVLSHFVYEVTPGAGFYGWLAMAGMRADGFVAQLAYLVFAGALMLAAIAVAAQLRMSGRDRLWLGFSVAALLIPRVMSQDVFLLGPGLVVTARRAADMARSRSAPSEPWARGLLRHGPHIVWGLCFMAFIISFIQHGRYSTPLALLGFCLYLIGLGAAVSRERIARTFSALQSLSIAVADPETRN